MKISEKFNKTDHTSETRKLKNAKGEVILGLHEVRVAGKGQIENSEGVKEDYSYTGVIVLMDKPNTLAELKKLVGQLVSYKVETGTETSELDAIVLVWKAICHAENIDQRAPLRPSVNGATGAKEVNSVTKDALSAGVTKEEIMVAVAGLKKAKAEAEATEADKTGTEG